MNRFRTKSTAPKAVWNALERWGVARIPSLEALVIAIANINVWNRLNVATRQIAGEWVAAI